MWLAHTLQKLCPCMAPAATSCPSPFLPVGVILMSTHAERSCKMPAGGVEQNADGLNSQVGERKVANNSALTQLQQPPSVPTATPGMLYWNVVVGELINSSVPGAAPQAPWPLLTTYRRRRCCSGCPRAGRSGGGGVCTINQQRAFKASVRAQGVAIERAKDGV